MAVPAYPVNSSQHIIPSNGAPTDSLAGVMGQVALDVTSATPAYYQRISGHWYALGSGPGTPVLTTITGTSPVNNSTHDGKTQNVVTFNAKDASGNPMGVPLNITLSGTTAKTPNATVNTIPSTGTVNVTITDTVAEAVTVTATSGSVTGTATSTFT